MFRRIAVATAVALAVLSSSRAGVKADGSLSGSFAGSLVGADADAYAPSSEDIAFPVEEVAGQSKTGVIATYASATPATAHVSDCDPQFPAEATTPTPTTGDEVGADADVVPTSLAVEGLNTTDLSIQRTPTVVDTPSVESFALSEDNGVLRTPSVFATFATDSSSADEDPETANTQSDNGSSTASVGSGTVIAVVAVAAVAVVGALVARKRRSRARKNTLSTPTEAVELKPTPANRSTIL